MTKAYIVYSNNAVVGIYANKDNAENKIKELNKEGKKAVIKITNIIQ